MTDRRTRTRARALDLGIVLALLMGVASAGKPPKDPPPELDGGFIYYLYGPLATTYPEDYVYWKMDPDGSNKDPVGSTLPNHMTCVSYGGSWWRLEYRWNATEGDDEFWIVEVDGNGSLDFELNFDAEVYPSSRYRAQFAVHDGVEDGKVSFLALRGERGEEPSEHGLQVIYIDWANRDSTPAETLIPAGSWREVSGTNPYYWISATYTWSPNGESLVCYNFDDHNLKRVDCDFENETWVSETLLDEGGLDSLTWSPDGTRIAFTSWTGLSHPAWPVNNLETIAPDGSSRTMLVEGTRKRSAAWPKWSPSGSHLVYAHMTFRSLTQVDHEIDIYRITKDGGDSTNLTDDFSWNPNLTAWADE